MQFKYLIELTTIVYKRQKTFDRYTHNEGYKLFFSKTN